MHRRPHFRFPTHDWLAADRTGGPLDGLLDELRQRHPDLWVERLEGIHEGDDDNVFFIGGADLRHIVQVGTCPDGQPPFIIEADDSLSTPSPAEAIDAIEAGLSPTK